MFDWFKPKSKDKAKKITIEKYFESDMESFLPLGDKDKRVDNRDINQLIEFIESKIKVDDLSKLSDQTIRIISNLLELSARKKFGIYPEFNLKSRVNKKYVYEHLINYISFLDLKEHPGIEFVQKLMAYSDLYTLRYVLSNFLFWEIKNVLENPQCISELNKILPELLINSITGDDELACFGREQKHLKILLEIILDTKTNPDLIKFLPELAKMASENKFQPFFINDFLHSKITEVSVQNKLDKMRTIQTKHKFSINAYLLDSEKVKN